MIAHLGTRGLCQRCRFDLKFLYERGLYNIARIYITRPARLGVPFHRNLGARSFSHASRRLTILEDKPSSDNEIADDDLPAPDDATLASQQAALERFEKELGKTLEQAVEESSDPTELITRFNRVLHQIQNEDINKVSDDKIAAARNAGTLPSDIVREVRQMYGDTLPDNILTDDELVLYRRLYGEPAKALDLDEVDEEELSELDSIKQNQLYTAEGEEVKFRPFGPGMSLEDVQNNSGGDLTISKARDLVKVVDGELMDEDESEDLDEDEESTSPERGHPLTRMGKFSTYPKTTFLSQDGFIKPVEKIMSGFSNKHLKDMCERTFGGPGLPNSPLTPRSGSIWLKPQKPISLDVTQNTMGEMEANAFVSAVMPPTYASIKSVLVETRKRLGPTWLTNLLAREGGPRILDAGAGGVGIVAWREIVQAHWDSLHTSDDVPPPPPASKSVVLTGSDGLRHRAAALLENTTFIPRLPDYVHTRDAPTLEDNRPSQRRKQFDVIIAPHSLFPLQEDWMRRQHVQNLWTMLSDKGGVLILIEKGIPRGFECIANVREMLLERYIAIPKGQKTYYSQSHSQQMNDESIYRKEQAMIVAPCTNHEKCPMYTVPGLSRGRKDICSFQQRYIRPPFLQRILGAKDRNHDDVDFSYLSVLKGDDLRSRDISTWEHVTDPLSAPYHPDQESLTRTRESLVQQSADGFEHMSPDPETSDEVEASESTNLEQLPSLQHMPRIVYPPLKRRGHVTMDLCTPKGQIERWTIPRSYSKPAYRDARKSRWGDLWALGAKTQIPSTLKLGTPEKELVGRDGEIFSGKGRGRKERLKIKAMKILEQREEAKMDELMEQRDLMAALDEELEADAGVPRDMASVIKEKPMNNRERKAAKRASRDGKTRGADSTAAADLTFRPSRQGTQRENPAAEYELSEWQAEFDTAATLDRAQKRNRHENSTKAARQLQKEKFRAGNI